MLFVLAFGHYVEFSKTPQAANCSELQLEKRMKI